METRNSVLVVFGKKLPAHMARSRGQFDVVIASIDLKNEVMGMGAEWVALDDLVDPGSIHSASAFADELSQIRLSDGTRLVATAVYKKYELWWIHYNNLFTYFCLPFTQYTRLLAYLQNFNKIYCYDTPSYELFSAYLESHDREVINLKKKGLKRFQIIPLGLLFQMILTLVSLPVLLLRPKKLLVFTGDKFAKDRDYDFRLQYIYEELRNRRIVFTEWIRGLEPWKKVLSHAVTRRRPVVYSEAIIQWGKWASRISGGHRILQQKYTTIVGEEKRPDIRFRLRLVTHYLRKAHDDIWAIRIMQLLLRLTGVRVAYITTVLDRNFHAALSAKIEKISTVGILHGAPSRFYNTYDFLPGYEGRMNMQVDMYGVWSEWWKSYYEKYSKAFGSNQLFISGPMRPMQPKNVPTEQVQGNTQKIRALFISEQLAAPDEVLPYLKALLEIDTITVQLCCRPYRDGFEQWLQKNHPELLERIGQQNIFKNGVAQALPLCDVAVGSHSTGVLEGLLYKKPIIFYMTKKWGDCFELDKYHDTYGFFAHNPQQLINLVEKSHEVPTDVLLALQERFFGDPSKNGSVWVVDQLEKELAGK